MMDERYRDELDRIRLTKESREDLALALAARQEQPAHRPRRRWSRTAVAAAVLAAVLVGSVGRRWWCRRWYAATSATAPDTGRAP